jgi:hypothetical protein
MTSLQPFAIHRIAINNIGIFFPVVRSKFVFLLPQKPPGCLSAPGKLAFCARWLQKEKWTKIQELSNGDNSKDNK